MCVCNCAYREESKVPARTLVARPRLFHWMTALLLTSWVLVVGVAANKARLDDAPAAPTLQAFIEELL